MAGSQWPHQGIDGAGGGHMTLLHLLVVLLLPLSVTYSDVMRSKRLAVLYAGRTKAGR
jgi:hypothetical protein